MRMRLTIFIAAGLMALDPGHARADLSLLDSFNPSQAGLVCGVAYDPGAGGVWVYPCFGADIQRYSPTGTYLGAVARPGESANDVDLEIAPTGLQLGATQVPQGALLFINGETGVAEIYALDATTGAVLGSLVTAFGNSHVVGGAYHSGRSTFFLLQDQLPSGGNGNRIAEIDPVSGAVLQSFTTMPSIDVSYGDLDVCASTGNLFVVSSLSASMVEFTPTGGFVAAHALPGTVTEPAGLAVGGGGGELWAGGPVGLVWRMSGPPCGTVSVAPPPAPHDGISGITALHPNPVTSTTRLRFALGLDAPVTVRVHDVAGRALRTLFRAALPAGVHELTWDARDDRGARLPAGTYFVRVTTPQWNETRAVVVVRGDASP